MDFIFLITELILQSLFNQNSFFSDIFLHVFFWVRSVILRSFHRWQFTFSKNTSRNGHVLASCQHDEQLSIINSLLWCTLRQRKLKYLTQGHWGLGVRSDETLRVPFSFQYPVEIQYTRGKVRGLFLFMTKWQKFCWFVRGKSHWVGDSWFLYRSSVDSWTRCRIKVLLYLGGFFLNFFFFQEVFVFTFPKELERSKIWRKYIL